MVDRITKVLMAVGSAGAWVVASTTLIRADSVVLQFCAGGGLFVFLICFSGAYRSGAALNRQELRDQFLALATGLGLTSATVGTAFDLAFGYRTNFGEYFGNGEALFITISLSFFLGIAAGHWAGICLREWKARSPA